MPSSTIKSAYWTGFRDSSPFIVVAGPFAMLFGVLATEAGLSVFETLSFSVVVVAGASQFAALSLMEEYAPTAIILLSAIAVNLRMAMYSAALTPHLGGLPFWHRALAAFVLMDQCYALSSVKFDDAPQMPLKEKVAYYWGTATPVGVAWYVLTLVGAVVGEQIPESWNLDFAIALAFLALTGPMLRTPAHVIAGFVAVLGALLAAGLPYNLGLIVGGLSGMMAGARSEIWLERRTS